VPLPRTGEFATLERFVKEYDIAIAIHNHGPEDKEFPTPQSVLKAVRDMDPRCGLCVDLSAIRRVRERTSWRAWRKPATVCSTCISRTSCARCSKRPQRVRRGGGRHAGGRRSSSNLRKMGYKGCVNLEYEIDGDDPMRGMLKSFSYMRGVLAGLKG
jgi:hypothetical protein